MKDEFRDYRETITETERLVEYRTDKAKIKVHIPIRTPKQEEAYQRNVCRALSRYYHAITSAGHDWDELVAAHKDNSAVNCTGGGG